MRFAFLLFAASANAAILFNSGVSLNAYEAFRNGDAACLAATPNVCSFSRAYFNITLNLTDVSGTPVANLTDLLSIFDENYWVDVMPCALPVPQFQCGGPATYRPVVSSFTGNVLSSACFSLERRIPCYCERTTTGPSRAPTQSPRSTPLPSQAPTSSPSVAQASPRAFYQLVNASVAVTNDDMSLVIASQPPFVYKLTRTGVTWAIDYTLNGTGNFGYALALSPDFSTFVTSAPFNNTAFVFDTATGALVQEIRSAYISEEFGRSVTFTDANIAVGGVDQVEIFDSGSYESINGFFLNPPDLVFGSDVKGMGSFIFASSNNSVRIFSNANNPGFDEVNELASSNPDLAYQGTRLTVNETGEFFAYKALDTLTPVVVSFEVSAENGSWVERPTLHVAATGLATWNNTFVVSTATSFLFYQIKLGSMLTGAGKGAILALRGNQTLSTNGTMLFYGA